MKHKSAIKTVAFGVLLFVALYLSFKFVITGLTNQPFSFGFWSSGNNKTVQNFVVAGVDEDGTRTDLILLCQYNFSENSLDVLQIPRDTKIDNNRYDKKINSAYGSPGQIETLYDEIEWLTGIRAEKKVIISFEAFRELVDAIGGVEVDVPIRMYYTDPAQNLTIDLQPGLQVLDGEKAEMFMRFRQNNDGTGYANGDVGRVEMQKNFYAAVLDQTVSLRNVLRAPSILSAVTKNVETDFSFDEMTKYVGEALTLNSENVRFHTLPGYGGYAPSGISYFFHNTEETNKLISEYFSSSEE